MSKAYDLLLEWRKLSDYQRDYAIQFMTGGMAAISVGFNPPHQDSAKANWAVENFEGAIENASKQPKEKPVK